MSQITRTTARRPLVGGLALAFLGWSSVAAAFNLADMMNPNKWFGGNDTADLGVPFSGTPGYGYADPLYGIPGHATPAYPPAYGYEAAPPYVIGHPVTAYPDPAYGRIPAVPGYGGYTPAPAYGTSATVPRYQPYATPQAPVTTDSARIEELERRMQRLEAGSRYPGEPNSSPYQPYSQDPGTHSFRPTNKQ
ncbi:MAG: hypothetical protein ABFS23_06705 [Pseudomonadota bacterium]